MTGAVSTKSLVLGAVAYDPKVVTIWDGFRRWFGEHDLEFDYTLYSNNQAPSASDINAMPLKSVGQTQASVLVGDVGDAVGAVSDHEKTFGLFLLILRSCVFAASRTMGASWPHGSRRRKSASSP